MSLDEARHFFRQLLRRDGGFLGGLGSLLGGLPRLFRVLPFLALLLGKPGQGVLAQVRVLLQLHLEAVLRRGLDIPALGAGGGLGRVVPDGLPHTAGPPAPHGLAHQLGVVGPLGPHVLMLHLVHLAVDEAVNAPAQGPRPALHGAGGLGRGLGRQLLLGRAHAELGLFRLDRAPLRPRLALGAPLLPLLPQPLRGPGPFALLVELGFVVRFAGPLDTVSRRPGLTHWPCPPAWWSGGCKARCPGGSGPQRGWWCPHKKAAPRRTRSG